MIGMYAGVVIGATPLRRLLFRGDTPLRPIGLALETLGAPVVAVASGGPLETVKRGETGYLVEGHFVHDDAAALKHYLHPFTGSFILDFLGSFTHINTKARALLNYLPTYPS